MLCTILFAINFESRWGDEIWVIIEQSKNHQLDPTTTITKFPLQHFNDQFLHGTIDLDIIAENTCRYYYTCHCTSGYNSRTVYNTLPQDLKNGMRCHIQDRWIDIGFNLLVYNTKPFSVLNSKKLPDYNSYSIIKEEISTPLYNFKIIYPHLQQHETICLLGNCTALKNWDTQNPIQLKSFDHHTFFCSIDLKDTTLPIEYKYGIYNTQAGVFIEFEMGANRTIILENIDHTYKYIQDGYLRKEVPSIKMNGLAIPLFSIRTERGLGIGELPDIKELVDLCKAVGLSCIQLLPIHDTNVQYTNSDSYPYSAISTYAINPIYLNIKKLCHSKIDRLQYHWNKKRLNRLKQLDYSGVIQKKMKFLKKVYSKKCFNIIEDEQYQGFFNKNQVWLVPYCIFCHCKDTTGSTNYETWPIKSINLQAQYQKWIDTKDPLVVQLHFYGWVQFQLQHQLKDAVDYAHQHHVFLKADLPIGVNPFSVETWHQPELFNLDKQTGAPPDAYSELGQNWGFPTYNWSALKETHYQWWINRLTYLEQYFDALRIDHVLGFFRIWSIPSHAVDASLGYFVPAAPLTKSELQQIPVPLERLDKPYITKELLTSVFNDQSKEIKEIFLEEQTTGYYQFKELFDTQKKTQKYLNKQDKKIFTNSINQKILSLHSQVILVHDTDDETKWHFRFNMHDTYSFKRLDQQTQDILRTLYHDYFFNKQKKVWQRHGLETLTALKRNTKLLICAEDLGFITPEITDIIKQLCILSLEIQRMPKNYGQDFVDLSQVSYLSVSTPSTHDSSTLKGWWEDEEFNKEKLYTTYLHLSQPVPQKFTKELSYGLLKQFVLSPSLLSIFPIQDLMHLNDEWQILRNQEERINDPGNPNNYWGYRMPISLKKMIANKRWVEDVQTLFNS
ncbi:MAG: 4-alpha-glucanotransferase [Phycisphaerales bacterium]|nr:4-alpha-glucanotransferase [Phycisphaerales bacterium]